jgi:hypothetical protein
MMWRGVTLRGAADDFSLLYSLMYGDTLYSLCCLWSGKGEGKGHPRTGHEGPGGGE